MKSYKDLEIYKFGLELFFEIHKISLLLPRYELYELGSQIRRSADSVVTNIVEGYGRRIYKTEFIRFLHFSYASCLETICHLGKLAKLYPDFENDFVRLNKAYDILGAKIYKFIKFVELNWNKTENIPSKMDNK